MSKKSEQRAAERDRRVRENIDAMLRDTRYDALRTPGAQRALAVAAAAVVLGSAVSFLALDTSLTWIAVVGLVGFALVGWALRLSVRIVADAPDDALDERLIRDRDRIYLEAYRVLAGVIVLLALALMVAVFFLPVPEGAGAIVLSVTWGQLWAAFWLLIGTALLAPSALYAWHHAGANASEDLT